MTFSADDIRFAVRITVAVLHSVGFKCCLAGSAACYEWGTTRVPNDVDPLVLPTPSQATTIEALQALVVSSRPTVFSLFPPKKNPQASYRVLSCALSANPPVTYTTEAHEVRFCKVDLFLPGTISLPAVPASRVAFPRSDLPALPLLAALLHKVIAWLAHGRAGRLDKQANDVGDINGLIARASDLEAVVKAEDEGGWWYPDWFVQEALDGVTKFVEAFPDSRRMWDAVETGMRKASTSSGSK